MIEIDTADNAKLEAIEDYVNSNDYVRQYWKCANVIANERLGINEHGEKHMEIVTNNSLKLLRLLKDERTPGISRDYDMGFEDAEVVVTLAGLLHDVGHIIHRYKHSEYSLPIASELIEEILAEQYTKREIVIFKSEILHSIQSHHKKANPLTLEAGILRVADTLDMEKGRASTRDADSTLSIHGVSALSIENVQIKEGKRKPAMIEIEMTNSSGIFQLDELAREKIEGSGLEDLIHIRAEIEGEEKKIVDEYEL
jgi:metal-dependent HD superfamily phosphatase/phosphodiesterase